MENWFQPCTHTSHDSRDTRIILNFTPLFSKNIIKVIITTLIIIIIIIIIITTTNPSH